MLKQTGLIVLVVLLGVLSAIIFSGFFIGFDEALLSLDVFSRRTLSLVDPPQEFSAKSTPGKDQSVLGIAEAGYESLSLTRNLPLIEFEKISAPFFVPTSGIAGHKNYLYLPATHPGIDIWTSTNGKGLEGSKGYAVHAACSGKVTRVHAPNQEIEIVCDPISDEYAGIVPSLKVKTLYAHMGDAISNEWYHSLRVGQRVEKGEIIGYQGNISSFAPWNRVTHLHFGVYDLSQGRSKPTDPEPYIGVPTKIVGQKFEAR